jgi:hypothetical protein
MRIPSQFTEDNLYRRQSRTQNRRRGQSDSRKVIHLFIALALVLVMMRQAAKPQLYESFFAAVAPAAEHESVPPVAGKDSHDLAVTQIDSAITDKVVDGSVWRAGDFDALHAFLDDAKNIPPSAGPVVSVLPLLQQSDVYRNRIVRARGQVVRSERIDAQSNPYNIREYWQLWIRPHDGVARPFVVITPTVPPSIAAVGPTGIDDAGPNVWVTGRFLKRLAYQSQAGTDLAPVIVGKLISAESPGSPAEGE